MPTSARIHQEPYFDTIPVAESRRLALEAARRFVASFGQAEILAKLSAISHDLEYYQDPTRFHHDAMVVYLTTYQEVLDWYLAGPAALGLGEMEPGAVVNARLGTIKAPGGSLTLVCPKRGCGALYSASPADYFTLDPLEVMTCGYCGTRLHLIQHQVIHSLLAGAVTHSLLEEWEAALRARVQEKERQP